MSNESTRVAEVFTRWPEAELSIQRVTDPLPHYVVAVKVDAKSRTSEVLVGRATTRVSALREALSKAPKTVRKPRAVKVDGVPVAEAAEPQPIAMRDDVDDRLSGGV